MPTTFHPAPSAVAPATEAPVRCTRPSCTRRGKSKCFSLAMIHSMLVMLVGLGCMTPPAMAQTPSGHLTAIADGNDDAAATAEAARNRPLASLFPATTILYLEMEPASNWFDHPLRQRLFDSEAFLKIWRSPEVVKARGGLTLAELVLGDKLENIVRRLTAGGAALAVDKRYEVPVLIVRTESDPWLDDYLQRLIKLAGGSANNPQIEETSYRDRKVYKLDKLLVVAVGDALVVSEKGDLVEEIVDRLLDSPPADTGLPAAGFYLAARAMPAAVEPSVDAAAISQHVAFVAVDLSALRQVAAAEKLLGGRADEFAGELILGGILGVLHHAPHLRGQLTLAEQGPQMRLSAPYEHPWLGEKREHFVGPEGRGTAPPALQPDDSIASLSVYRNLSQLWLWAGELFDGEVNDQLAQADTTLTTLFSGHDFGTKILAALHPELQIVVSQPNFTELTLPPTIQLPAIALIARLREPDFMRGELKRIFQSLIGLLNFVNASNGQPQLDLGQRLLGDSILYTAEYVAPVDARPDTPPSILVNFSPSLAFIGDQAILTSSIGQAQQIVQTLQEATHQAADSLREASNTLLRIDGTGLWSILSLNRDQLIAQNMLEKGHSRAEAEGEIDGLLALITLFEKAELSLGFQPQVELNMSLDLK
jgi:hypothetical protein